MLRVVLRKTLPNPGSDSVADTETVTKYCDRPPAGWWCNLEEGHEGPCPTRQIVSTMKSEDLYEMASVLAYVVRAYKINGTVSEKFESLTEHQKDCYAAALVVLGLPPDYLGPEIAEYAR